MNKQSNTRNFLTDEFGKFIYAKWNRNINPVRVKQIRDSIVKHGYIGASVVVNEFMEVIDGQHRLEACKLANVPVEYTVKKGFGMEEAIALNKSQRSWSCSDYIDAYAEYGNENYIRLRDLINKSGLGIKVAIRLLNTDPRTVTSGSVVITKNEYEEMKKVFEKLIRFKDFKSSFGGISAFYIVLGRLIKADLIDVNRMHQQLEKYGQSYPGRTTIEEVLKNLNEVYNFNRTYKEYFADKYRAKYNG